MLNPDQARIFNMYEKMFAEPGWRELVEDLSERRDRLGTTLINDLRATERELAIAQGANNVYNYIINLEEILAKAKAQAEEAARETEILPEV